MGGIGIAFTNSHKLFVEEYPNTPYSAEYISRKVDNNSNPTCDFWKKDGNAYKKEENSELCKKIVEKLSTKGSYTEWLIVDKNTFKNAIWSYYLVEDYSKIDHLENNWNVRDLNCSKEEINNKEKVIITCSKGRK